MEILGTLTTEDTIRSALVLLNSDPFSAIYVLDQSGRLLGSVTDGDIRRGLLRSITIDDNVSTVMNASPISALYSTSSMHLQYMMEEHGLDSIPLVDAQTRLVRVERRFESSEANYQIKNNPIFIMAGGFGSRLYPLTRDCPKPMLTVNGKPILRSIIEKFKEAGFRKFYISTHYLSHVITDYFGDGTEFPSTRLSFFV